MRAIVSDAPRERSGSQCSESGREKKKPSTIDLSRLFPWSGGQGGDGGNEADDESLRKMKTNKQRQLRNQMDLEKTAKSAERADVMSQVVLSAMMWKVQLEGVRSAERPLDDSSSV